MAGAINIPMTMTYRRGEVEDLKRLRFSKELDIVADSIEFNVVGMGHEFWIAVEESTIIAIMVLGRANTNESNIMYLQVAKSRKGHGVGSSLLQSVLDAYPTREISVVPFVGTEQFYSRLGFKKTENWEMRRTSD